MPTSPFPTTSLFSRSPAIKFPNRASYFEGAHDVKETATDNSRNAATPDLSFAAGDNAPQAPDDRRTSVQFTQEALRRGSSARFVPQLNRRMSSPPPPTTYNRGVSFDTFDNRDATDFSMTLNYKHKDYQHTRRSRIFLCGTDQKDYSEVALQWLLDELIDDGDEIVCLRVVEKDSKIATDGKEEGKYRTEAQSLLDSVIAKNTEEEKAISLVVELAVGKVQEIIQRMIQIYEPAVLVVGTRGRNLGGMQGLLPGSVSKYCLQQSPIPVIVVRPSSKRAKKKKKRMNDPTRRNYNQILELSEAHGGQHLLDKANRNSNVGEAPAATDQEAIAVARAIGLPKFMEKLDSVDGAPLAKAQSARSDYTSGPDSPSPTGPLSPEPQTVIMKSPVLKSLENPQGSGEEDEQQKQGRIRFEEHRKIRFASQPGRATGPTVDEPLVKKMSDESSSSGSDAAVS